jgi:hypothetical protein
MPPSDPPSTNWDSDFDPGAPSGSGGGDPDAARRALLRALRRGLRDRSRPVLCATYGPDANLRFDFRSRLVVCDPPAVRRLRIDGELPLPAPAARPLPGYLVRELDETAWDIGVAAGTLMLMAEPEDWWHTPLAIELTPPITRFTRLPAHVELAQRLRDAPATPSALRRQAHVDVATLRGFIQVGLLVGLLDWAPEAGAPRADGAGH